jgi:hypothetical protein
VVPGQSKAPNETNYILVAVREKGATGAPVYFAETAGKNSVPLQRDEITYDKFRADDLLPGVAPQPQIGGTIGFKRVPSGSGEKVELDASKTTLELTKLPGSSVVVQQASLFVRERQLRPWSFLSLSAAQLRTTRPPDLNGSIFLDVNGQRPMVMPCDPSLGEIHVYVIVTETDSRGRDVHWRFWNSSPIQIPTNGDWTKVLANADFDRAVSGGANPVN